MLPDEAATLDAGARFARNLAPGLTFYLVGDLGAGKTTFVRGLLQALGYGGRVKSPTYTLVETYTVGGLMLNHYDLYRMRDPREWLDAGFCDTDPGAVNLIEWPDRGAGWAPRADVDIVISIPPAGRILEARAHSAAGWNCVEAACDGR